MTSMDDRLARYIETTAETREALDKATTIYHEAREAFADAVRTASAEIYDGDAPVIAMFLSTDMEAVQLT